MSTRRRLQWLCLTPEPEQELPAAVAALRAQAPGRPPPPDLVTTERRRVQRLVLRGTRRGWLRYLSEVTQLVVEAAHRSTADARPALVAGEVVLDHHRMLIGLPGTGYARTAGQRRDLEQALALLRARRHSTPRGPTQSRSTP
ncbi:hypothetical protein [Streptomyces sp. NPDC048192]|uniref:hypothetical protein n=1 Tax=unclassified Streptomyces TaxID=2593676 RepID=UPI003710A6EC